MDYGINLILQVVRRGEQDLVANENDSLILQWQVCRAIREVRVLRYHVRPVYTTVSHFTV